MTWEINEYQYNNRGIAFDANASNNNDDVYNFINGIEVMPGRDKETQKWWIITIAHSNESRFEDLGPFETVEDCIIHLRLLAN